MPELPLLSIIIIVYIIALIIGIVVLSLYAQKQSSQIRELKSRQAQDAAHLAVTRQELLYAQKRLEDSNKSQDAESVLSQIPDAVLFINPQGTITVFSPQAEKLFGIDRLSAVLKPYTEIVKLSDRNGTDITEIIAKSLDGQDVKLPLWTMLVKKDGRVPVSGSLSPVRSTDGQMIFIVIILHDASSEFADITAKELELSEAKKSAEDYRSRLEKEQMFADLSKHVISEMKTGIICVDADWTVTIMNKHAEQFTGMLADTVTGQNFRHVFRMTNSRDEEDFSAIEKALKGETVQLTKWMFFTKRGGKGAISGTVIPSSGNGPRGSAVLVFHDAQKEFEEETEEKAFFSGAAHDLRSPLTTIRSVIELLYDSYGSLPAEEAKEILGGAKDSVIHLIDLVNDLLNVSRIEMGRIAISADTFDIIVLTKEAIETQNMQAKKKHLFLTHEITDIQLPKVKGDRTKSQEILINLLNNAVKYTQQGGITVKHEYRDNKVITTVTDTGAGISPENKGLLFKKFQQVGQSRHQPMTKSTGLGLYIAKKFATLMGGDVELIESTVGRGSTFAFTLPVAHA